MLSESGPGSNLTRGMGSPSQRPSPVLGLHRVRLRETPRGLDLLAGEKAHTLTALAVEGWCWAAGVFPKSQKRVPFLDTSTVYPWQFPFSRNLDPILN